MAGKDSIKGSEVRTKDEQVEGWKAIANALGISMSRAQIHAKRDEDPLPAYVGLRGIYASKSELEAWRARQEMTYQEHLRLESQKSKAA